MLKIFLGYPSERLTEAKIVLAFLESLDLTVWHDKKNVLGGEKWRPTRENAQREADYIIHLYSREMQTRPGEVHREIQQTLDQAKNQPPNWIYFVLVRLEDIPLPEELSDRNWVDYFRPSWQIDLARSIARKFEQKQIAGPTKLSDFIAEFLASKNTKELVIEDINSDRELRAHYLQYLFSDRYFLLINSVINSVVLSEYFSWNGALSQDQEPREYPLYWSMNVEEYFRSDKLVSLRFSYDHFTGGIHPNHGTFSRNFGGEFIGEFDIARLFGMNKRALEFLLRYVDLDIRRQMMSAVDLEGSPLLVDIEEFINNEEAGWSVLSAFNFDQAGITFIFSPYAILPYAAGTREVKVPWEQVVEFIDDALKRSLKGLLVDIMQ